MEILTDQSGAFLKNLFLQDPACQYEIEVAKKCFEALNIFIVAIDLNGKITYMNNRAKKVLGYGDEDDLEGSDFISILVRADKQDKVKLKLNSLYSSQKTDSKIIYPFVAKHNSRKIIDSQTSKIYDNEKNLLGILISGRDVTDYSFAKQELQKDIDLYRLLLNNIPDVNIFMIDEDLRFLMAEGIEMKNAGLSQDDLTGKTLNEIPDQNVIKIWTPLFKSVISGEEINTEYSLGNNHYLIRGNPLTDQDSETNYGMFMLRNITEEKHSRQVLDQAREEAIESAKAKSRFIARVSHDIRTPLNAIMGFTEQLLQSRMTVKQKKYVGIIDQSAEHLLSLVNDILTMSKIEANQVSFENRPFKPGSPVKYVYNALKAKAVQKKLHFTYDIDEEAGKILIGDSFRLQQILMNMLGNAIKFTDRGSVSLRCSLQSETDKEVLIKFEIADTGIGIAPEHQKMIFNHYSQVAGGGKGREGTGLGLSICKSIIELQNGSLTVSSGPGKGTTFSFVIPYRKGTGDDTPVFDSVNINPAVLEGLKVLLVDDDSMNLFLGSTVLKKLNCSFDTAESGKQALRKLNRKKYDIILLDIHMPDISGIKIAEYIRSGKQDRHTKIIALTAAAMKDDIELYKSAGIDDIIFKPFREIYLYNKLCEIIGKKPTEPIFKPEIKNSVRKETGTKPYDLSVLHKMSDNNEAFVKQTLEIFVQNSEDAVKELNKALHEKRWRKIGEISHKILPSCRHLEIGTVVPKLLELKSKTLYNENAEGVEKLVEDTIYELDQVTGKLKKEMNR